MNKAERRLWVQALREKIKKGKADFNDQANPYSAIAMYKPEAITDIETLLDELDALDADPPVDSGPPTA